jgi:hypothetical protein
MRDLPGVLHSSLWPATCYERPSSAASWERCTDALLIDICMAIAESVAKTATAREHELRVLYGDGTETDKLLHRFAREQRIGAFENSPDRVVRARAIL